MSAENKEKIPEPRATIERILRDNSHNKKILIITSKTNLNRDLKMDDLDMYESIYKIEEETGVEIPDEKTLTFKVAGDIWNYVQKVQQKYS